MKATGKSGLGIVTRLTDLVQMLYATQTDQPSTVAGTFDFFLPAGTWWHIDAVRMNFNANGAGADTPVEIIVSNPPQNVFWTAALRTPVPAGAFIGLVQFLGNVEAFTSLAALIAQEGLPDVWFPGPARVRVNYGNGADAVLATNIAMMARGAGLVVPPELTDALAKAAAQSVPLASWRVPGVNRVVTSGDIPGIRIGDDATTDVPAVATGIRPDIGNLA